MIKTKTPVLFKSFKTKQARVFYSRRRRPPRSPNRALEVRNVFCSLRGLINTRGVRFRSAKIDRDPIFHFAAFIHHDNGAFKSYRKQENGSLERVEGGYQQQFLFCVCGTTLKIPPILRPNGFFEKDFFAGPLAWCPPCPTPEPPGCSARAIVVMTGSGAPGTAMGHAGGVGGGVECRCVASLRNSEHVSYFGYPRGCPFAH